MSKSSDFTARRNTLHRAGRGDSNLQWGNDDKFALTRAKSFSRIHKRDFPTDTCSIHLGLFLRRLVARINLTRCVFSGLWRGLGCALKSNVIPQTSNLDALEVLSVAFEI